LTHPKLVRPEQLYSQCKEFQSLYSSLERWADATPDNSRLLIKLPEQGLPGCLSKLKTGDSLMQSLAGIAGWNIVQSYITPRPYYEFKLFGKYSSQRSVHSREKMLQGGVSHILTLAPNLQARLPEHIYTLLDQEDSFALYQVREWQLGQDIVGCIEAQNGTTMIRTPYGKRTISLPQVWRGSVLKRNLCTSSASDFKSEIVKRIDASDVNYQVTISAPAIFVSDRVMGKDWVVHINGEKVDPETTDGYRLSLELEAGESVITVAHRPWDFLIGLSLSILGLLATLSLVITIFLPKNRLLRGKHKL
jgi:hypothetical protein